MEKGRDDFVIAIRSAFLKKGTQQRFSIFSLIIFSIVFLILGSFNLKAIDYIKNIIKDVIYTSSFIASIPENLIQTSYKNKLYFILRNIIKFSVKISQIISIIIIIFL